jgi:hypothetical protein
MTPHGITGLERVNCALCLLAPLYGLANCSTLRSHKQEVIKDFNEIWWLTAIKLGQNNTLHEHVNIISTPISKRTHSKLTVQRNKYFNINLQIKKHVLYPAHFCLTQQLFFISRLRIGCPKRPSSIPRKEKRLFFCQTGPGRLGIRFSLRWVNKVLPWSYMTDAYVWPLIFIWCRG